MTAAYLFRAVWNVVSRGMRTIGVPLLFLLVGIGAINIASGDPVGIMLMRVGMGFVVLILIASAIMLFVDAVRNELENLRESR